MASRLAPRQLLTAEILSIGSELTVGDTRDTNAGELARSLTSLGVRVTRLSALPDDLDVVAAAFRAGLERADLVVSTGGLGPTPDDLTREAIAATAGETPVVDPVLERWLRRLWARRSMPFLEINLKQAWLIPSAVALANPNGTAPGWLVSRPDGRAIVALPGPPREMRPMWHDHAVPRLRELGLGADVAAITYRLAGIGESQVADLLGEGLLRTANPVVATYARVEAVDVRVAAVGTETATAADLVETTAAVVREQLGAYIWATGDTTWADAIGRRLEELGWTIAIDEVASGGRVAALFGDVPWIRVSKASAEADAGPDAGDRSALDEAALIEWAEGVREAAGTAVGLVVHVLDQGDDAVASIAVATPTGRVAVRPTVFLGGANGRIRAALASASALLTALGPTDDPSNGPSKP